MEFHPRDLPTIKTYDLRDEQDAMTAAAEMVEGGFRGRDGGYRVLMPKESKTAKRIGYSVTTAVTAGLGKKNEDRDIRYWTYHHDADHYAMVLIHGDTLKELGF